MVFDRSIAFIILVSGSLGLTGCSTMRVSVDVMNPEHVKAMQSRISSGELLIESRLGNEDYAKNTVIEICDSWYAGAIEIFEAEVRYLEKAQVASQNPKTIYYNSALKGVKNSIADYKAERTKLGDENTLNTCLTNIEGNVILYAPVKEAFIAIGNDDVAGVDPTNAIGAYRKLVSGIGNASKRSLESNRDLATDRIMVDVDGIKAAKDASASAIISSGEPKLAGAAISVVAVSPTGAEIAGITKQANDTENNINAAVIENSAKIEQSTSRLYTNGYLGSSGRTLVMTDIAFAAANADDRHWKKDYNIASGSGLWGSTDTVIKLNDTADFSVKGLVFDARATAIMARKLTVSSLQLLASGSGVPVRLPDTKDENGNTVDGVVLDANDTILKAKSEIQAQEIRATNYRAALKRVAYSTLSTANRIDDSPPPGTLGAVDIKKVRAANRQLYLINEPIMSGTSD